MTSPGDDLFGPKRRAAKFHAESRCFRAENNFLGLFREENVLGDFACFFVVFFARARIFFVSFGHFGRKPFFNQIACLIRVRG